MPNESRVAVGRLAEERVAQLYRSRGFEVLGRNVRLGPLELDLVARRAGLVVFCEVRFRTTDFVCHPAATIDAAKKARIRRAAVRYLEGHPELRRCLTRFDVVAVCGERLSVYPDAF